MSEVVRERIDSLPLAGTEMRLQNYIGGQWVSSASSEYQDVFNPARGQVIAKVPLSTSADVDAAVEAATGAFPKWRATPVVERARYMFKLKALLDQHFEELARIVTTEHGKTLDESRGSVKRGIECVEVACGMPSLMMGYGLEDVAPGIDCEMVRQPMGVFAAIAPFNFPAMVPLWFLPFAVASGNTFILKPSEQVPLSQKRIFGLLHEAGLPPGVVNLVNGAKEVVNRFCEHPGIRGVSFVGSTPVARYVYQTAAAHGKRVQSLGGAKNFIVVMPDADMERSIPAVSESIYGCAGERCLAGSVVVTVGKNHGEIVERFVDTAKSIRVGDGSESGVRMGPVISERHRQRVLGYIQAGVEERARLVLDGSGVTVPERPNGFFVGPTVFDQVRPEMKIGREEIFGPVASIIHVHDLDEAIKLAHSHPNANAISIFTSSGKAARQFRYHAPAAMVGINIGVAAPMSFFPFGGSKDSFFGDLKAHGRDGVEFYTEKKVTISRWL
ncbi:MAG TPA: CoA-acylating methylmalonate-semialdehyde dehydrogenase [Acidobacteriota bacterium]|jgi:malonate-semialdehyde dehydrogenase (acetylating)/methylmalonate-semialdehyde dehydrogenase